MRVFVMMAERRGSRINPVWQAARQQLESAGVEVVYGFADEGTWRPTELSERYDRFVLKSRSAFWFQLASGLDALGCVIDNPYLASCTVANKLRTTLLLDRAGLPVPEVVVPGRYPPREISGKWVLKPTFGHRGQGVRFVEPASDRLDVDPRTHFLQRFVDSSGYDIKIKVLGEQVAAMRRVFDPDDIYVTGAPMDVSPALRELALRIGRVLDLSMYGIDVLDTTSGFQVVDVNLVPSYRQFPEWTDALAAHLSRATDLADATPGT